MELASVVTNWLPDAPKEIWQEVRATATAIDGPEDVFTPSINKLTEAEAVDLAKKITTVEAMVGLAKKVP